jgi:two-component system chemotaxis response regulator CheB
MVNPDVTVGLSDRERNPFRPSGNWLFESAAAVFDERVVAVVLSGGKDDGARGVLRVRARGGKVIVQDPSTCTHPEMPRAAIATGTVDFIAAPEELGTVVMEYVSRFDLTEGRERWEDPFSS